MSNLLRVNNLSFRYTSKDNWLFQEINLELQQAELLFVKGASGIGKTTLLYILNGVIPKMISGEMQGEILFKNYSLSNLSLPETAPKISLQMQQPDHQLFFPIVEYELAFAPENLKIPPDEIEKRIDNTLQLLKIQELRGQTTHSLSFGQKKMVTLASLITLQPEIYLLDEPSAGLSLEFLQNIESAIKKVLKNGSAVIIADHNNYFEKIATRILNLDKI